MGNKESSSSNKQAGKSPFKPQELQALEALFLKIKDAQGFLTGEKLSELFPENKSFAAKLFKWMLSLTKNSPINYERFALICELLTKDKYDFNPDPFYFAVEKSEIFLAISLGEEFKSKADFMEFKVEYKRALVFANELLNINSNECCEDPESDLCAKSIVDEIFDSPGDSLSVYTLSNKFRNTLLYLNKVAREYFCRKFLESNKPLTLPVLSKSINLLSPRRVFIIYLSNSVLHRDVEIDLLYSTRESGTSFNRIAFALLGYDGPTMILVKHLEKKDRERGFKASEYIFGGFTNKLWEDMLAYGGDNACYIFSMLPKLRIFYSFRGEGGTSYSYLNTRRIEKSVYKMGLGFGGVGFSNYRLWIDDDIEGESYVTSEDKTFENGYLTDSHIQKLNIEDIEIYGFGGDFAKQAQNLYRENEQKRIEKARKVDRGAFSSGFDQSMFFGKAFAHKDQVRDNAIEEHNESKENKKETD